MEFVDGESEFDAGDIFDADHFRFHQEAELIEVGAVGVFGDGDRLSRLDQKSSEGTGDDEIRPVSLKVPGTSTGDTERNDGASGL